MGMVMSVSKDLEVWTAQTLCDTGILLSVVAWLLHLGRPYFERLLSRFSLRVAGDLWWLLYVLARDGSLLGAALLGLLTLNLDLMADIKVGLPFVPFGTVTCFAALLAKVFANAEDLNRAHLRVFYLVSLAGGLNLLGYVFVMEAPGPEYALSRSAFWAFMSGLRSNQNPGLAAWTFHLAAGLLALLGIGAFVRTARLLHRRVSDGSRSSAEP